MAPMLPLKDAHRWRDTLREAPADGARDLALLAVERYLTARESAVCASDFAREQCRAWIARRPDPGGKGRDMSRTEAAARIPQLSRDGRGEGEG